MMIDVRISSDVIDSSSVFRNWSESEHGAQISFAGVVRGRNHGREVTAVSYDAFEPLAETTLKEIAEEARDRFGKSLRLLVWHRVGTLKVGETSLLIGASSPHRDEAYRASRYVIEEIKKRAPIWKKEIYRSGESEWLRGHALCSHGDVAVEDAPVSSHERYSRQIRLDGVGLSGQERLERSRVLVVGAGGLGSPSLLYLASAGVGTLGVIDPDRVDVSNLQRQVLYRTSDAGRFKVEAAYDRLRELNPLVSVQTYAMELTPENACDLFADYDLIIDGTDRFSAKALINDAARKMGKPWIYASVQGYESQFAAFAANEGACLRCLYPELETAIAPNCGETGVLGPWVGMLGSQQALTAIRYCLGEAISFASLLVSDAKTQRTDSFAIPKRADCRTCSVKPSEIALEREENPIDAQAQYLDVRREDEWSTGHHPSAMHWPLSELENGSFPGLVKTTPILTYCASGARARRATQILRSQGFTCVDFHSGHPASLANTAATTSGAPSNA